MTTNGYFTPSELALLRNAAEAERRYLRDQAKKFLDLNGDWVGTEEERKMNEAQIKMRTRLLAKLNAPAMY